jgi:hypothetical protein
LNGSPQKDVTALADVLRAGGFEVVVLKDAAATKKAVEERFKALLEGDGNPANAIGKKDLLLVAVCTHGFTLPPAAGKPDQPFLAAHDSKLNQPGTMVPLNGLIDAAKSSGATCLYLLDACREMPADANRGATRGVEGENVILPKKTTILFSCGRGQVAHQHENVGGHGLFTAAVLRALRTDAGPKDDVSWTELVAGVQRSFRSAEFKEMIPAGKPQTPVLAVGGEFDDAHLMTVKSAFNDDLLRLIPDEPTTVVLVDVLRASQGKIGKILIDKSRTVFRENKSEYLPLYEAALKDANAVMLGQYAIDSGWFGKGCMALSVRERSDFVTLMAAASKDAKTVAFEKQSIHLTDEGAWTTIGGTRVLMSEKVEYDPPSREFADVFGGLATRKFDGDRGAITALVKAADLKHHILIVAAGKITNRSMAGMMLGRVLDKGVKPPPDAPQKDPSQVTTEDVVSFSAGITLGDQLLLEVNMTMANAADAKVLAREANPAGKTSTDALTAAVLKTTKVTVKDKVVTIRATLTEQQVVELLKDI